MKHERNERLLKKIRPKVVLNILYQEKRFDRELFNRIKNKSKKDNKKIKSRNYIPLLGLLSNVFLIPKKYLSKLNLLFFLNETP